MSNLRKQQLDRLNGGSFDVLVVGGGINGAAIAAALAARGAGTALIDRGDFACGTSQESSNLIWGGIKYMESYEFGLVRKLCRSRNELLRRFPTVIEEIRFLAPVERGASYPAWYMYLGTWLYWLLGNGFTRIPRYLGRRSVSSAESIIEMERVAAGFEYSDAFLPESDARFVFGFVRAAMGHGAAAANYIESAGGRREGNYWVVAARDAVSDQDVTIRARVLVNAAGPGVDAHNTASGIRTSHRHLFSKGIHLVVPQLTRHRRILAFMADDGRPFFIMPLGARTCIGTTDTPVEEPVSVVTDDDIDFVLTNINRRLCLKRPLSPQEVISTRCGVRPLAIAGHRRAAGRDFLQLSRKHVIEPDSGRCHLSVFGGKLTDCINVANEVCGLVGSMGVALSPGEDAWCGEPAAAERDAFLGAASEAGLDTTDSGPGGEPIARRLWRCYGSGGFDILDRIDRNPLEANEIIANTGVTKAEVRYLAEHEMIVRLDDFLRRRTLLSQTTPDEMLRHDAGLREACDILFGADADARFAEYFESASSRGWTSNRQHDLADVGAGFHEGVGVRGPG